jgi:hypothetical protein
MSEQFDVPRIAALEGFALVWIFPWPIIVYGIPRKRERTSSIPAMPRRAACADDNLETITIDQGDAS